MKTIMKKVFVLLILVNSTIIINGQTLSKLDEKFGVSKFKLESNIEQYRQNVVFLDKSEQGSMFYEYIGNDIDSYLGVPVNQIILSCYQNKIYQVKIIFKETQNQYYDYIFQSLETIFGPPSNSRKFGYTTGYLEYQKTHLWGTQKTELFLFHQIKPHNEISIMVGSISLYQKMLSDSF